MKDLNRLTAKRIERLKEPGRYHDGAGLILQISKKGARSWLLRYQRNGREHMAGLGPLSVVPLKEARERARKAKLKLLDGVDPIDERRARRSEQRLATATAAKTFRYCALQFLNAHEGTWRNAAHRQQWHVSLRTYAFPVIGDVPVGAVDTDRVLQVLQPIWASKRETASRVRGRIERVLDWAKACGLRNGGENPARWKGHLAHLLGKDKAIKTHLAAMPYSDVPGFVGELRGCEGVVARALEFTILTAARTGETLGARWSEIDLDKKEWVIPPERMKAGKEHRVPLSDRVVELLRDLPREQDNAFVFIGRAGRLGRVAMWGLLRTLRKDCTAHGFRSAFRDWAAETTSFPHHVAEKALAHSVGNAVEQAYQRGDLFAKRRMLMEAWASYCAAKGAVVPLFGGGAA